MPRRKRTVVVRRDEWGGLKLSEETNEHMDKFQREIVSFRNWLQEQGLVLQPVVFTITKHLSRTIRHH